MVGVNKRKKKIIKPQLQWRIMIVFAVLAMTSVMLQAIVLGTTLVIVADQMPNDGYILESKIQSLIWTGLLGTVVFLLPLNLLIGRALTFKIAGPLYRFEVYLKQIAAGERPGPCRIRKDDELQELCQILNEAVAPLSTPLPEESRAEEVAEIEEPAAPLAGTVKETPTIGAH